MERYPPIAKDAFAYLAVGAVATALAWFLSPLLSAVLLLGTLFVSWFFRDPERAPTAGDDAVLSPADGTVLSVQPVVADPDIGQGNLVSIFMSVINVHVNRCPVSGEVADLRHHRGGFLVASRPEAPEANERNEVVFRGPRGKVKCVQIAGLIARRIVCRLTVGERVAAGSRYGLIKFGSRVDVYIPEVYTPAVAAGDRVRGVLTVLARAREANR